MTKDKKATRRSSIARVVRSGAVGPARRLNLQDAQFHAHLDDLAIVAAMDQPCLNDPRLGWPAFQSLVDVTLHDKASSASLVSM